VRIIEATTALTCQRILWKDTSGHSTGIILNLRPDLALLTAEERGNIGGHSNSVSLCSTAKTKSFGDL